MERNTRRTGTDVLRESHSAFTQGERGKPLGRAEDRWLERWLGSTAELARLQYTHRMVDAVIDEQNGRDIRIGDQWLADFASCNYLGFDLDEEIIGAIPEYLSRWGTHPSWSRLLGSPVLYEEIEEHLAELLHVEAVLLLPTITHIHMAVLPVLAGSGTLFLDRRAHKTIYDGSSMARARGSAVHRFPHNDLSYLEEVLETPWQRPGLIAIDGVNSMTGNGPPIAEFAALAREHDALLYVDDAHGFGVVGDRAEDELCSYGKSGNGIVRHVGETYENIIFVGGFSKAYSSLMAFVTCPKSIKEILKTAAPPYLYSGPSPVASLATVKEGLRVNDERGNSNRLRLHQLTERVLNQVNELGIVTPNDSGFPIIEIPLADGGDIDEVGNLLFDRGIYVTMAAYPLVPRHEVGFRIQVTSANTDEHIDRLNKVLVEVAERFQLQSSSGVDHEANKSNQ